APSSRRSRLQPAGAATPILSTRTVLSPPFHTVTSICKRSPGVTIPSSAVPSIDTPAAIAIARSSKVRGTVPAIPTSRRARHRHLEIRLSEDRIEDADGQRHRRGGRIAAGRAVELLRPPGGVAEQVERLPRENRRDLMVPVPIGRRPGEYRDDDLRPEPPD